MLGRLGQLRSCLFNLLFERFELCLQCRSQLHFDPIANRGFQTFAHHRKQHSTSLHDHFNEHATLAQSGDIILLAHLMLMLQVFNSLLKLGFQIFVLVLVLRQIYLQNPMHMTFGYARAVAHVDTIQTPIHMQTPTRDKTACSKETLSSFGITCRPSNTHMH